MQFWCRLVVRNLATPEHYNTAGTRFETNLLNNCFSKQFIMLKSLKTAFISSSVLESPKFQVVNKHEGFEERLYEPSVWASVESQKSMGLKETSGGQFSKLFRYIQGKNKEEKKVEMTVPVIRKVEPGPGPACEGSVDMSFFVPHEFHDSPPEPTESGVKINRLPEMTVYVSSFGGYANDDIWLKEALNLSEKIPDQENVRQSYFYTVAYNSPWQFFNRTNEVWFVKTDQSQKTGNSTDQEAGK